jgi:hypothetical protein
LNKLDIPRRMQTSPQQDVERYLCTGEHDELSRSWPGDTFLARAQHGDAALRDALVSTVRKRTAHAVVPAALAGIDVVAFTRTKVEPMVRGLFPAHEQQKVLDVLARSVVFLTPATIDTVLQTTPWLHTVWDLANLYLVSCGAEPLSEDARLIVGLSAETTCFVASDYFSAPSHFDDFVVHEAAHIFHNCKRRTIGLSATPRRGWLLDIDYRKRETFAYACEAYSRVLELGNSSAARRMLLSEVEEGPVPPDDRVDPVEYIDILREAIAARNGWKRILRRCSPAQAQRRSEVGAK